MTRDSKRRRLIDADLIYVQGWVTREKAERIMLDIESCRETVEQIEKLPPRPPGRPRINKVTYVIDGDVNLEAYDALQRGEISLEDYKRLRYRDV